MASYVSVVYGMLLVAGGLIGYVRSSSLASLAAGGATGAAVVGLELVGAGGRVASGIQTLIAGSLAVVMYQRYSESGKVMPAGMVALFSAGSTLLYANRVLNGAGKSHAS
jgi:uncharacterized membrane protein (UPF0136 family)